MLYLTVIGTYCSNIICDISDSNGNIVTLAVLYLIVMGQSNIRCALSDSNGNIVTLAVLFLIVMGTL